METDGVRAMCVVVALALGTTCSQSTDDGDGRSYAAESCVLVDNAWTRASLRADAVNDSGGALAHPAHVGDDGFEPSEWSDFEHAAELASSAADADDDFEQLDRSLQKLLDGKGSGGVAAVADLVEPINDAFDECVEHGLLAPE